MNIRESAFAGRIYRILEERLLPRTEKIIKRPDHFTILGLVLAFMVPVGFYIHPFWGFITMGLSGLADIMDGLMAKKQKTVSLRGAFLDSSTDRISDFLYLVGIWALFLKNDMTLLADLLIWLSMLSTFMISYVKARAEGLNIHCQKGLMERGLRTIYLIVWALLLSIFPAALNLLLWTGLGLYFLLTAATVIQRIFHIMPLLDKDEQLD